MELVNKYFIFKVVILSFYKLIEKQTQNNKQIMHKKRLMLSIGLN